MSELDGEVLLVGVSSEEFAVEVLIRTTERICRNGGCSTHAAMVAMVVDAYRDVVLEMMDELEPVDSPQAKSEQTFVV